MMKTVSSIPTKLSIIQGRTGRTKQSPTKWNLPPRSRQHPNNTPITTKHHKANKWNSENISKSLLKIPTYQPLHPPSKRPLKRGQERLSSLPLDDIQHDISSWGGGDSLFGLMELVGNCLCKQGMWRWWEDAFKRMSYRGCLEEEVSKRISWWGYFEENILIGNTFA